MPLKSILIFFLYHDLLVNPRSAILATKWATVVLALTFTSRTFAGLIWQCTYPHPWIWLSPFRIHLFGLIDEDAKSVTAGNFERHWEIYRYDGQPKYAIDVSGQSQNKFLVPTQNMEYLPNKLCVFNPNAKDLSKLANNINFACTFANCTTLGYRSSCNNLDANRNASYAFNMYFQI